MRKLALQAFAIGGAHKTYWCHLIAGFDWISTDELEQEARDVSGGPHDLSPLVVEALKERVPNLTTTGHVDALCAAFAACCALSTPPSSGTAVMRSFCIRCCSRKG